jgi:hypothetical protein
MPYCGVNNLRPLRVNPLGIVISSEAGGNLMSTKVNQRSLLVVGTLLAISSLISARQCVSPPQAPQILGVPDGQTVLHFRALDGNKRGMGFGCGIQR